MNHRTNVKSKTIKPLDKHIEEILCDFELGKDFLDRIQKAQIIKEIIDELNFVKSKNVCS